jgi:hypothetical protein
MISGEDCKTLQNHGLPQVKECRAGLEHAANKTLAFCGKITYVAAKRRVERPVSLV